LIDRIAFTLLLAAAALAGSADEPDPIPQDVPTVTLCELTASPQSYDRKVVRVRATYASGFEASILEDRKCGERERSVWVEFALSAEASTASRVWQRWQRSFRPAETRRCDNVIVSAATDVDVTFVGRFEAKRSVTINGRTYWQGFGHLNGYDYELTVLAIERVGRAAVGSSVEPPAPLTFTIDCEAMNQLPL
jgi:hypothetical protein